jgi:predicted SprT family Zn-dependent metalloprotease
MDNLREVRQMANRLMSEEFTFTAFGKTHTLSGNNLGYSFKFDNARRRLGCCNYRTKTISLSKHLCLMNLDKVEGKLKDTVLHELAHAFDVALYGLSSGHGPRWVRIAQSIGCDGQRCYSSEDVKEVTNSKYTHTCPTCGNTTPRHKKIRRSYSCAPCSGGRYNPQHKLILTQNY